HKIVLHPHGIVRFDQRADRVGKAIVGALIAAGISTLVLSKIDPVVEQRPQRAIGVAVVILLDILLFEVSAGAREAAVSLHRALAGELLGLLARPAVPDAAHFAQRRRKRDRVPSVRSFLSASVSGNAGRDYVEAAQRVALQGLLN